DAHPRYSPDGTKILFESNRSGTAQLYVLDLASGGEARKLTDISTGAGTGVWSTDGTKVAFVSAVFPEFSSKPFAESNKLNKEKDDAAEANPVKAKIFNKLFYRHWDDYVGDKRQHVFVINIDGTGCKDVTPGDRDGYPTSSTFSVGDDFVFSPNGKNLIITAVPARGEAWSTNHDLCLIDISKPSTDWSPLTLNPAADNSPRISPDGKKLGYRAQKKAGYEADKWDVLVVDINADGTFAGTPTNLTEKVDISVNEFVWQGNGAITLTADTAGANAL
ncbi:MAG: TolB family protein, partial [Gemmataceae bacterium]